MDPIWSTYQHYAGLLSNLSPDQAAAAAGALTLALTTRKGDDMKLVDGTIKPGQEAGAWGEPGADVSGKALVPVAVMVTVGKLASGEKLTLRPAYKSDAGTTYGQTLTVGVNGTQEFSLDANDEQPTTDFSLSASSSVDKSIAEIKVEALAWEVS